MKRLDFPVRPHLLKYLQVHLKLTASAADPQQLDDYVLSRADRFGFALNQLLRKPVKSARHEASIEDCTARLGLNLRNFNAPYYDLTQGKLSPYAVFQFSEFVDELFRQELYWWVGQTRQRRGTIKDAIRAFMALYEVSDEDIAYETLRRDVHRNGAVPALQRKAKKKAPETENFSMNLSQKMGGLSQKISPLSQKTGVLSHKDTFSLVKQELSKLPLPLFEADFFLAHAR
ncbi:MAG: hypothetical protein ACRYFZ_18220 [Janthinobacterium lividum]